MKKQFKIKLALNSQTVRRLRAPNLQQVQGGLYQPIIDEDTLVPPTYYCGGRACG